MKKYMLKTTAFFALALASVSSAFAVSDGHVYEFRPITAVNTVDTAFGADQKIQFTMRLISPNPKEPLPANRHQWEIYYKANPGATVTDQMIAWAITPLRLGVMVSGQVRECALDFPAPYDAKRQFTDFTCTYVTKFGDLALPMRLAFTSDKQYYLINNNIWGIRDHEAYTNNFTIVEPTMSRCEDPGAAAPESPRNGSIDLAWGFGGDDSANKAYFIKTVGFDSDTTHQVTDTDGSTWWRTVKVGRTKYEKDVPTIVFDNTPTNIADLALYVWSEDESIVTMKVYDDATKLAAAGITRETFTDKDGTTQRTTWVKKIKINSVDKEYPFDFKGVATQKSTKLVLRPEIGYLFHEGTSSSELIPDFMTVDVKSTDPMEPTVTLTLNHTEETPAVKAYDEFSERIATLTVEVGPYNYEKGNVTVSIESFLAKNGQPDYGANASNYFGVSFSTDANSCYDKVKEVTFVKDVDTPSADGMLTKTLYIYGWGADENTYGVGKGVAFVPDIKNTTVKDYFTGGMDPDTMQVRPIKPSVLKPEEGDLYTPSCATPFTLPVRVSDDYNDMMSTNGFELLVKRDVNSDEDEAPYGDGFMSLGKFIAKNTGNGYYLYSVPTEGDAGGKQPSITWNSTATKKAQLYLRSPLSGQVSATRTINVSVNPAKVITATITDDRENNQYYEGDDVNVQVEIKDGVNDTGAKIYAFLVPLDNASNVVDAAWLAKKGGIGREIGINKSAPAQSCSFTLLDGTKESKTGALYAFKIELRTDKDYLKGEVVSGFESEEFYVNSLNKAPYVSVVEMNNGEETIAENGAMFETRVAKGVTNKFTLVVVDGVSEDVTTVDMKTDEEGKRMQTRYIVRAPNASGVTTTLDGNPNTNVFEYAFTKVGTNTVDVMFKDKDMTKWQNGEESNSKFTFKVVVVANPMITVTGISSGEETREFYESAADDPDQNPQLRFNLTMNPFDDDLTMRVTIEPTSTNPTDNRGILELEESTLCRKISSLSIGGTNVYEIAFSGLEQSVNVKTLDGTSLTRSPGFRIRTEILDETAYPGVPGETAKSYIMGSDSRIYVRNDPPVVESDTLSPSLIATNKVAIGYGTEISWNLIEDVKADFRDGDHMTVMFTGGGGTTNIVITDSEKTGGTWKPYFSDSGTYSVTMTVKDKDNGRSESFTWWYEVAKSKKLTATAHGPSGGKGSANSKRYRTAAGLGEGHIYAGTPTRVSAFESTFNCQLNKTWTVWGFGYKVDNPYDDGTLNGGKDVALDVSGNQVAAGTAKESCYNYMSAGNKNAYKDANGNLVDSFLYTWLQITRGEDSSSLTDELLGGVVTPEYSKLASDAGAAVGLPTEEDEDGLYDDTMVEAIFSREYLASDNMGDINQDGIPDIYLDKYGLGIIDTSTGLVLADGSDLTSVKAYNEDGDMLPKAGVAQISTSWSYVQSPFTAFLEIRGYGEALNDAPVQLGIKGVEPDLVYTNPNEDKKSTLTYAEWLAWCEYAAATYPNEENAHTNAAHFSEWSPERPTDPTVEDTDDDGFDDGFEYYYWYRAHVGWVDANGNHKRLTGRRYNPRNPAEGDFISPTEIEAIMDPRVASGSTDEASTRDTDNDGLPDLIEFYLGTNPFDFDTDGDGLPDGWEICIAGTSPTLTVSFLDTISDGLRNLDGDAMAFTTSVLESDVKPMPKYIMKPVTFAARRETMSLSFGDANGVQWYVMRPENYKAGAIEFAVSTNDEQKATLVETEEGSFIALGTVKTLELDGKKRLAVALDRTQTFALDTVELNDEKIENVALTPTYIGAGTIVKDVKADTPYAKIIVKKIVKKEACNTGWVYGQKTISEDGVNFGMLTIGRLEDPEVNLVLTEAPSNEREVAYIHSLVYQEFGFDPRTAWNSATPLAARWGTGEYEDQTQTGKGGYVGKATRTRDYTTYDEFLVFTFFLNGGADMEGVIDYTSTLPTSDILKYWMAFTTNPHGPNAVKDEDSDSSDSEDSDSEGVDYYGRNSENGADTDGDGVPDGWELYIMAGPKDEGQYVFAPAYAGFAPACRNKDLGDSSIAKESYWSPFVAMADDAATDNANYVGKDRNDNLTERQEFAGTDTIAYYTGLYDSTTIKMPDGQEAWINKFLPTDPWNPDTDGDGIKDGNERSLFAYGGVEDDGTKKFVAGGGLNPCTIDTDMDGLPDPWEADFAGKTVGKGENDAVLGYIDGMDGTVWDAYSKPSDHVNRDYDHDGLENFQEYLTGTMRCWRYDDPYTTWTYLPYETYYRDSVNGDEFDVTNAVIRLYAAGKLENDPNNLEDKTAAEKAVAEFWYKTLFDKSSEIYNPYLVTDTSPGGMYWTHVDNGWDLNYCDIDLNKQRPGGTFYFLRDRINGVETKDFWCDADMFCMPAIKNNPAQRYMTCSPIEADTDGDGMDDYYELFHGLNPILGDSNALPKNGCADVISYAYGDADSIVFGDTANNHWLVAQPRAGEIKPRGNNTEMDFTVYPWRNGLATADADGDDIRNQIESLMPMMSSDTWLHTDPSALWMTDHSYSNSLVRMYYRVPRRSVTLASFPTVEDENGDQVPGIVYGGKTYFFRDTPAYAVPNGTVKVPHFPSFIPEDFGISGNEMSYYNWMFSFEENEGFDSDHDALSDNDEAKGKFRASSDPQDADSPKRRQAMYFPGENAVLQTMLTSKEGWPENGGTYPDDPSFLQFTAECWANPAEDALANDQVILERAIWSNPSANADAELVRKNFQIGLKNGHWYAKFDSNGTDETGDTGSGSAVQIQTETSAEAGWHHLALTFDGSALNFYVDSVLRGKVSTRLQPEYGSSVLVVTAGSGTNAPAQYLMDQEYAYQALLVGASVKPQQKGGNGKTIDVSSDVGWTGYERFFKGYVDEIRIWDGARSADEIKSAMNTRFDRDDALANRSSFYSQWVQDYSRNSSATTAAGVRVVPELRYHFHFDSVPGAADTASLAKAPHGFDYNAVTESGVLGKAFYVRPENYEISWWQEVLANHPGTIYNNPAWIQWIPNTVTHLPRFDGSTLDSFYWGENFMGLASGTYSFKRTAEPVSLWQQAGFGDSGTYGHASMAHDRAVRLAIDTNTTSTAMYQFMFTARHLNQSGDDLLPLGGAFVKYCDEMWDDQGASSTWEVSNADSDNDGLPDWWDQYARQNYMDESFDPSDPLTWTTIVNYHGVLMTAGEAYMRDLAAGTVPVNGKIVENAYPQTADSTGSGIPDWWEELYQVSGEAGTADTDNDGLNNRTEYLISETYPFNIKLNPRTSATDGKTIDYFRRPDGAKLYLGEMFADHDFIEDAWERAIGDLDVANASIWDATRDADEDGWSNFAECRYNKYCMSTLSKLVSHLVGGVEILDAPMPTIRLTVRDNEDRELVSTSGEDGAGSGGDQSSGDSSTDDTSDVDMGNSSIAPLIVNVYSDEKLMKPDATYEITPGQKVEKAVYLGGWEDRIVRGTMGPGHINVGDVNLKYTQLPQTDKYSWTDENGIHISGTYEEFKAALEKNPDIFQNIDEFTWLELATPENDYTTSDRAVTVSRDPTEQTGYISIYGERVGTINLETGEYEFDMSLLNNLTFNAFYTTDKGENAAWGIREAIYKLTYSATVPSVQTKVYQVSLAKPDAGSGYIHEGKNTLVAFYDCVTKDGKYTPGEPMGVVRDVDVGWSGTDVAIELTTTKAMSPRVDLWTADAASASDRGVRTSSSSGEDSSGSDDGSDIVAASDNAAKFQAATAKDVRVRVVRYQVDNYTPFHSGTREMVTLLDKTFQQDVRTILHEGDFMGEGEYDIDWDRLESDVVNNIGVRVAGCPVTNVNYLIVFGDDNLTYDLMTETNNAVAAHPTLISRRFEKVRTAPTAVQESAICMTARPTFSWKIENEDPWASAFGTTYTAFKVKVWGEDGSEVYDSGYQRMPVKNASGVYSWKAPLSVDAPSPSSGKIFANTNNYTWQVFTYNAKFKTDTCGSAINTFRMSVSSTGADCTFEIPVRVGYVGPATALENRIHVQAFESPDFTGEAVAEAVLAAVDAATLDPNLDGAANVTIKGLKSGKYFIRAYIDTDSDFVHDAWESWGYLSNRDQADVGTATDIFTPVSIEVGTGITLGTTRLVFIEDCDTNGNYFPDVWEAEQNVVDNNYVFDASLIAPATGNVTATQVNPNLKAALSASEYPFASTLSSVKGVMLLTGLSSDKVSENAAGGVDLTPSIDADTLRIVGFTLNAEEKNVTLKVGADLDSPVSGELAEYLNVTVKTGVPAAVKVYNRTTLGEGEWTLVAEKTVTISGEGSDSILVDLGEDLPKNGYFKVEVVQ